MERKILNACMRVFAFLIATTMISTCVHRYADSVYALFERKSEYEKPTDLYEEVPAPAITVTEFIDFRDDLREQTRVDSIFMAMSEGVLTHILYRYGTDLSLSEIVNLYESNKEEYDKMLDNDPNE